MPQYNKKNKKAASGMGNIRKVTKIKNGKEYTYYEARYTEGYDPGTGKQIQRSISGETQKLKAVLSSIDRGDYIAPCKMTVGEWLDKWSTDYLGSVKPATVCAYKATINTHLKPGLGAVRLDALEPHIIQSFYNGLLSPKKKEKASFTQDSEKHPRCTAQGSSAGSIQWAYPHKPDRCLCSSPC